MRVVLVALVVLTACPNADTSVCGSKVAKEIECDLLAREDGSTERDMCEQILAGADQRETFAFAKTRYDHDAACARAVDSCGAYVTCMKTYDLEKAREQTAAKFRAKANRE